MYQMTLRRKLAIATWKRSREGNIYGKLQLDATLALRYIAWLRETTGEKVTITHFVGRAMGLALERTPSLNGRVAWGRYIPHDTVNVSFLVALDGGKNLAKAKISNIDKMTLADVARDLRGRAERLRQGKDEQFNKSMGPLKLLPTWLIRPILMVTGWLTGALGVNMPMFGLEAYPFGGAVITSVGMFGLDEGFAPHTPFARSPVFVLVCAIRKLPSVIEDEEAGDHIEIRPMITVTATIDHRFIDGFQGGVLAKTIRQAFDEPWILDGRDHAPWEEE